MSRILLITLAMAASSSAMALAAPTAAGTPGAEAANSAPSERLELARQFIDSMGVADKFLEGFREGYWQTASADGASEGDRAASEKTLQRLISKLEPELRRALPGVLETYAQVYAREFSAADLRQLIAFAESPVGKRYLSQAAVLENDPLLLEAQAQLWEKLAPTLESLQKEMCADRAAERFAAGDSQAKCPLLGDAETQRS